LYATRLTLCSYRLTTHSLSRISCLLPIQICLYFFLYDRSPTEIYTLSLHDALPISFRATLEEVIEADVILHVRDVSHGDSDAQRSEEHTSELQSHLNLVCRLLLEKKKTHKHPGNADSDTLAGQHAHHNGHHRPDSS